MITLPQNAREKAPLRFFNTLGKKVMPFEPLSAGTALLYTCGPTVYGRAHIGNLRAYIFEDALKKTLLLWGYEVKHLMNVTDVGHLVGDGDDGEDKMEKAKRQERRSAWDIAEDYYQQFKRDIRELNVAEPDVWSRATDYIPQQIAMVQTLEKKGFAYRIADGVYFDVSKFPAYGDFAKLDLSGQEAGARVAETEGKRNPQDFALWKLSPAGEKRDMEWESPWGVGFPGWHVECSAMIKAVLGDTIDIHCGGIDHVPVHHTNEIAQSECANGVRLANYWLHNEFLLVDGQKMSKSLGNVYDLGEIAAKNFDPLAFRFWTLQAHYRQQLNFTWDAMKSAQAGLERARKALHGDAAVGSADAAERKALQPYLARFAEDVSQDLGMPGALATLFAVIGDETLALADKRAFAAFADQVLGLDLLRGVNADKALSLEELPAHVQSVAKQRQAAREDKDFKLSDELRDALEKAGFSVKDGKGGQEFFHKA